MDDGLCDGREEIKVPEFETQKLRPPHRFCRGTLHHEQSAERPSYHRQDLWIGYSRTTICQDLAPGPNSFLTISAPRPDRKGLLVGFLAVLQPSGRQCEPVRHRTFAPGPKLQRLSDPKFSANFPEGCPSTALGYKLRPAFFLALASSFITPQGDIDRPDATHLPASSISVRPVQY